MMSGAAGRVGRARLDRLETLGTAWGVAVLATLLAAGCVSPPAGIEVVKGRELDDVPVKTGLEFVESETYIPPLAEGSTFRSWVGLYRGKGMIQEIGPWYVGAMKDHGWTFTGVVESKGPGYTYSFLKRDEEAVIRVFREYSLGTGRSINMVRAEVHPRGTESFLPEDFETMKAGGGVAWSEPREPAVEEGGEMEAISFTEGAAGPRDEGESAMSTSSEFLLEGPGADVYELDEADEADEADEGGESTEADEAAPPGNP